MSLSENRIAMAGISAVFALLAWASLVSAPIPRQAALKITPLPFSWVSNTVLTTPGYICYVAPHSSGSVVSIHDIGGGAISIASTSGTIPICTRGSISP